MTCIPPGFLQTSYHCRACGGSGTQGLPCKGGGTCNQAAGTCN
jgi:hypothetical protein